MTTYRATTPTASEGTDLYNQYAAVFPLLRILAEDFNSRYDDIRIQFSLSEFDFRNNRTIGLKITTLPTK